MNTEIVEHGSTGNAHTGLHRRFLRLFEEFDLRGYARRVRDGLRAPRESGERRWAAFQLYRCAAGLLSFVIPLVLVLLLAAIGTRYAPIIREGPEITLLTPEPPPPDWDDRPVVPDREIYPPAITDEVIEWKTTDPRPPEEAERPSHEGPPSQFTSQTAMPGVQVIKAFTVFKGLIGTREPGARQDALGRYAYGAGAVTEPAVLRALRWLKQEQRPDGSWGSPPVAMTGFALLCYLAHNEVPGEGEFGDTVRKAIQYLLSQQRADGRFPGNYDIPIATYALCEAYGMTQVPVVKEAAEKALDVIIRSQHASGGWDYNCGPGERDDTSYMGWCAQALKAGHMAGLPNPGLQDALVRATRGFKKNAHPAGGFGYTGPGQGGLTAVGTLGMQLLGAAREAECRRGIVWLEQVTFNWGDPWGARPVYYWYYTTQAKFHEGGKAWEQWNRSFALQLAGRQTVLTGARAGGFDVGYWDAPSETEKSLGLVYNTCLCTLMLEVYYRYLPTYQEKAITAEPAVGREFEGVPVTIVMPHPAAS